MTKKDAFLSPVGIFFIYVLSCFLAIMIFRFIFPAEAPPLTYFTFSWRIVSGFLDFLALFPALALSALVIPFGFKVRPREMINPFSTKFFQTLKSSIVAAIVAAAIYGALFFLALPLARDYQANLRFQGELYHLAREQAQQHAIRGEWTQAAQFLAISERIWPGGYQVAFLQEEAQRRLQQMREDAAFFDAAPPPSPIAIGPQPLTVTEALALAQVAMSEERFFDAHWLATVGGRLANPGSPEMAAAIRLAGLAWDQVNSLAPTAAETAAFNTFRLKLEGYLALNAEEWIRAYYIFLELLDISPADPDVHRFFAMSVEGLSQVAFFIDDMDMAMGAIMTGAVFSLPLDSGRAVLRFSSISMLADSAYGMAAEILAFNHAGQLLWSMEAPYAKMIPLSGTAHSRPRTVVLLRALDRLDADRRWEPIVESFGQSAPDNALVAFPVAWSDFALLSNVRRGMDALSVVDILRAAENLGAYGYKPEIFQIELIRRFSEPALLLLLGILAIVLGWRFRPFRHPGFMGILMLGAMPVVFYTAINLCRGLINNLAIWAVFSLGFMTAALFFAALVIALLILFLIILSSQHG